MSFYLPVLCLCSDFGTDFIHEPQTSKNYSDDDLRDEKCRLYGYGFACSRHGVIGKISAEIGTLIDLENPEISVVEGRVEGCLRYDQLKFSAEHYMFVFHDLRILKLTLAGVYEGDSEPAIVSACCVLIVAQDCNYWFELGTM